MTTFVVHKLNTRGELVVTYEGELAERLPDGVLLDARWTRPPLPLGYTTFAPGDRFREWYYTDRCYSIFEIASPNGTLKGWYCNIAEPAVIAENTITYRDLLLDLWVAHDGALTVLDEDEFAADHTLGAATRSAAWAALDELRRRVGAREPPFDAIVAEPTLPE
jgi:hypothetical protein